MCAILDLGCAKPMGSRRALLAFKRAAWWHGIICWEEPTWGRFTFADSRTSIVRWKMVVQFPTNPPVTTSFDIVEEGNVPILFSLGQMKNLQFDLRMTPAGTRLTCPSLGYHDGLVPHSTTGRLVIDLSLFKKAALSTSFLAIEDQTSSDGLPYSFAGRGAPKKDRPPDPKITCPACLGKHVSHTYKQNCYECDPDKAKVAEQKKLEEFQKREA